MSDDLDKVLKTDKDKAAAKHLLDHKSLIKDIVKLSSGSCRRCKAMITRVLSENRRVEPELFCVYCRIKHAPVFDKINKTLEGDE